MSIGINYHKAHYNVLSNASLPLLKHMQILKKINPQSPDGVLEGILRRGEVFARVNIEWYNQSVLLTKAFNGGFVRWHNRLFLSWRSGRFDSKMLFDWAHEELLLQDGFVYENILGELSYKLPIVANWSESSEDGRLFPHPDPNKLYCTFTFYTGRFYGIPFTALSEITLIPNQFKKEFNFERNIIEMIPVLNFSEAVVLHIEGQYKTAHKNWIPFEYQKDLYYVTQIYPFRIVKYEPPVDGGNEVYLKYLNESYLPDINHTAVINDHHSVHSHNLSHHLHRRPNDHNRHYNRSTTHHTSRTKQDNTTCLIPWDHLYGLHIRGGTPALKVSPHQYLSFFHSVREIWGMNTYFIGAFTFSTTRPFKLLEMSRYPIAQSKYYDGKWLNKYVTYVVFPMSFMLDQNDSQYLWLSFGHQDSKSYIQKFNVQQILSSLEPVINC